MQLDVGSEPTLWFAYVTRLKHYFRYELVKMQFDVTSGMRVLLCVIVELIVKQAL